MILLGFSAILLCTYAFTLWLAHYAVKSTHKYERPENPVAKISVIVPVRNEEKHIRSCLLAILDQDNSGLLKEIIVVDDHSEDRTAEIVLALQNEKILYTLLPNENRGKKAAITSGVSLATSEYIAVTDGDSVPAQDWLREISKQYTRSPETVMTTGLVFPVPVSRVLIRFQWLDFAATMALTAMGIQRQWFFLANGANMSFRKSAFYEVNGYQDNEHIASGDDVFLVSEMARLPGRKVSFLSAPGARVTTEALGSVKAFMAQRQRWAQKTKSYAHKSILLIQGLAFVSALGFWLLWIASLIYHDVILLAILYTSCKFLTDFIFLRSLSIQHNTPEAMKMFPVSWLLYQVYIVWAGVQALWPGHTKWKGRTI